jgi:hypothetical protein
MSSWADADELMTQVLICACILRACGGCCGWTGRNREFHEEAGFELKLVVPTAFTVSIVEGVLWHRAAGAAERVSR